jgi:hypothetical protein
MENLLKGIDKYSADHGGQSAYTGTPDHQEASVHSPDHGHGGDPVLGTLVVVSAVIEKALDLIDKFNRARELDDDTHGE